MMTTLLISYERRIAKVAGIGLSETVPYMKLRLCSHPVTQSVSEADAGDGTMVPVELLAYR